MSNILVDSSVWIDYFRGGRNIDSERFNEMIDANNICTNDLILSELIPLLKLKKESEVIDILQSILNIPLAPDWHEVIEYQYINLKNGINRVGIPDLLIMQNVIQNDLILYSLDSHFIAMKKYFRFRTV